MKGAEETKTCTGRKPFCDLYRAPYPVIFIVSVRARRQLVAIHKILLLYMMVGENRGKSTLPESFALREVSSFIITGLDYCIPETSPGVIW